MAMVGTPITRPTANTARQPMVSTRMPPISGPAANDSPITAPQMPIAHRRSAPWNSSARMAREQGNTIAAPTPWSSRAAISEVGSGAAVHRADAALNSVSPIRNSLRRP